MEACLSLQCFLEKLDQITWHPAPVCTANTVLHSTAKWLRRPGNESHLLRAAMFSINSLKFPEEGVIPLRVLEDHVGAVALMKVTSIHPFDALLNMISRLGIESSPSMRIELLI
jgi:hypothetical protein